MIAIVDYNMGNLASVQNAFTKLGCETIVVSDPAKFKEYDKLILPGVGAFGDAMEHLRERNMIEAIREYAASGKYMLGIDGRHPNKSFNFAHKKHGPDAAQKTRRAC